MQNQPTPGNPGIILPISPLVLIVEDDEMVRSAEERILSRHYRIKSANDGTTALPLIEEFRPNLVLSDVMMPKMDGVQLFQAAKKRYAGTDYDPRFLFATGYDFNRLAKLNGAQYSSFMKPVNSQTLHDLVKDTLAGNFRVTHEDYLKQIRGQ